MEYVKAALVDSEQIDAGLAQQVLHNVTIGGGSEGPLAHNVVQRRVAMLVLYVEVAAVGVVDERAHTLDVQLVDGHVEWRALVSICGVYVRLGFEELANRHVLIACVGRNKLDVDDEHNTTQPRRSRPTRSRQSAARCRRRCRARRCRSERVPR